MLRQWKTAMLTRQKYSNSDYRKATKNFDFAGKIYNTFQLKNNKGLAVVIKGIEPEVDSAEIPEALSEKHFKIKSR